MSLYRQGALEVFQTRTREPTEWELNLADAMENAFGQGAHELPALVAALNGSRVHPRQGGVWTEEIFTSLMRELGGDGT